MGSSRSGGGLQEQTRVMEVSMGLCMVGVIGYSTPAVLARADRGGRRLARYLRGRRLGHGWV